MHDPTKDSSGLHSGSSEWKQLVLGSVSTMRKEPIDPSTAPNLPYVGLEHIDSGSVDLVRWGKGSDVSSLKSRFLKGDILYGKLRPYLDKAAIAPVDGLSSTDILVLQPGPNVNRDFLAQVLHTRRFLSYANSTTTGLNHPRTSWNLIKEFSFHLPPRPEQNKIAKAFSAVREAIRTTQKIERTAIDVKRSLLNSVFPDGPTQHWPTERLADVCERPQYGFTASASTDGLGPKLLRITDIQNGKVNWSTVPTCEIPDTDFETYKLEKGDLLIARIGATTGKAFLVNEVPDAVFGSYLIRVRAKPMLIPAFLGAFTETKLYWDQVERYKGGRLKQGMSIPLIQNIELPLPPFEQQAIHVRAFEAINRKIDAEGKRGQVLHDLYRTMLDELLSGRVRLLPSGE